MTPTVASLLALVAWIAWIPGAALQKRSRGEAGSVSVFPVLPLFPLLAWAVCQLPVPHLATVVGAAHAIFIVALLVSMIRSYRKLKNQGIYGGHPPSDA